MKRFLIAATCVTAMGCVVPTATGAVAVMPPGAVVAVPGAHVHSLQCPHFWGYYGGRPVYYVGDQYLYYRDGAWVALSEEPVHAGHHHFVQGPVVRATVPADFWKQGQ